VNIIFLSFLFSSKVLPFFFRTGTISHLLNKKSLSSVKVQFATHEECVKTLVCLCAVVTAPNRALTAAVEEYLRSNVLKSFVEEIHQQQQEHQRSLNNNNSDPAVHQLNRINRPSSFSSSFSPAPTNTATPLSLLRIRRQQQQSFNHHFHHQGEENSSLNNNMSDGGNNSDNHSENSNYQDIYQQTYNESNDNSLDVGATVGQQLDEEQEEGHSGKESNISYDSLNISEDSGQSLLMEDLEEK
jgi:hypothetical protein